MLTGQHADIVDLDVAFPVAIAQIVTAALPSAGPIATDAAFGHVGSRPCGAAEGHSVSSEPRDARCTNAQMASAASSSDCQGAFEPRLFELKSLFPGNGIFRAETKAPKRPRSFKGRYCRDKISLS